MATQLTTRNVTDIGRALHQSISEKSMQTSPSCSKNTIDLLDSKIVHFLLICIIQ